MILVAGQVIITPTQLPQSSISLDNSFFIQLNNSQTNILTGQLQITINRKQKKLATITYQQTQLQTGLTTINTVDLAKVSEEIYQSKLKTSRVISEGEIQLCFSFSNAFDNTILGTNCVVILLEKEKGEASQNTKKNKKPLPLRFTGFAEVSGNYSNRQGSFQKLPANYTNVIVNPQLEVYNIPIGARLNYSTASNSNFQNMNLFNIYFDANKFRENVEHKYLKNLGSDYLLEKAELDSYKEKAEELDKLNRILANPYIVGELEKISSLDSLEKLQQDSSPYLSVERNQELQKRIDSLSPVNEKRDAFLRLLDKQKKLQGVVDIYENPIDTKLIKDSLNILEQQLNTQRDPFSEADDKRLNNIDSLLSTDGLSKSRREVLKRQRDRLHANKEKKQEYESLKENYSNLHHTYKYQSKLDSVRKQRGDYSSVLKRDSIQNSMRNPKNLRHKLKFLKSFKSINFGFFAPFTSELTLNGVPVKGFGAEMEFKKVFFGVATGKLQRTSGLVVENNSPTPFDRRLNSAWVGFGQANKNYISVQVIDAKDRGDISSFQANNNLFYSNAGNNKVLSTQFQTSFFKGKTQVRGEVAGSYISSPNPSTSISENSPNVEPASNWLGAIINQNSSGSHRAGLGYNISVTQSLNKNATQIAISTEKVSSNYVSFGTPFILTDVYINEAKVTQSFWGSKVKASSFYRVTSDNLDGDKLFTTTNTNFGGDISIRVPNWPTLRIMYMPIMQQTPGNVFNTNLFTVNSTYGLRKGNYYHQWTAIYNHQNASGRSGYSSFDSRNFTVNYFLSYKNKLSTTIVLTRIKQEATEVETNGFMGSFALGYLHKKKLNQQIGVYLSDNNLGNRKSIFYDLNYPIFNNLMLNIRYENTNYLSNMILLEDNSYIENLLTFSLIKKW